MNLNYLIDKYKSSGRAIEFVLEIIGTGLFIIMGLSASLAVADRYVIKMGIPWTEELCRFVLVWTSFIAAYLAIRKNTHFRVDYFVDKFVKPAKRIYIVIYTTVVGLLIASILIVKGIELCKLNYHQISPALEISMSIVYSILPLFGGLMLFEFIGEILKVLRTCFSNTEKFS